MSFLAPLYALGLLTIAAPILLHLIRRQPKDRVAFSSLLFLKPTPPRLTRRSRINHWFLLLLRVLAICALVLAFARPFLRSDSQETRVELGRRVIVMVDTSASMRRSGLWKQATDNVEALVSGLDPLDDVALINFDDGVKVQVPFREESAGPSTEQRKVVLETLLTLSPTNHATELGKSLQFAAEYAANAVQGSSVSGGDDDSGGEADSGNETQLQRATQLVVVSDLQRGSNVRSIQSYPWPNEVAVELRQLRPDRVNNATVQRLRQTEEDLGEERVRVRVDNAASSTVSEFDLAWVDEELQASSIQKVQVPPGSTRVVNLPLPEISVVGVQLDGDGEAFDNLSYFVQPEKSSLEVLYFGPRSEETREDLFYYLSLLPLSTRVREVTCRVVDPAELALAEFERVPLVVVAQSFDESISGVLRGYIETGGTVLGVLDGSGNLEGGSLNRLGDLQLISDRNEPVESNGVIEPSGYLMFSSIDYQHRLFASFSDPQFSDFSKIKFWSRQKLGGLGQGVNVVATFDDATPAIIEKNVGEGHLLITAFGWQPSRSQLALSTKFLPLIDSMVNPPTDSDNGLEIKVGEGFPFPPAPDAIIIQPDGSTIDYRENGDFAEVTNPGIYRYRREGFESLVAVNLASSESQTDAMDSDEFEALGVELGELADQERETAKELQLRDRELEEHQGLWQWALIAALVIIFVETLWASLVPQSPMSVQGDDGVGGGEPSTQPT